jgi:hypothetical protein
VRVNWGGSLWAAIRLCAAVWVLPVGGFACWAGLGPENCVLVVNGQSAESRQIANVYAQLRDIHPRNIIVLPEVPVGERCTVAVFREKILQPIFQAITERKLDQQVHAIIYSVGFPTQIDFSAWTKDLSPPLEKHQTPTGSLTSMTYLYRWTLSETPAIVGFDTNHYARRGATTVLDFPFSSVASAEAFAKAKQMYAEGKWSEAEQAFGNLLQEQPFQCGLAYWQSRCHAKAGDESAAATALMEAVRRGWRFRQFTEQDAELGSFLQSTAARATLKAMDESYWEMAIPLAFSAHTSWSPSGFPERVDQSPHHYLLSVALGVVGTNGQSNTVPEILSSLRRSVAADHKRPKGKFYFSSTSDVRTKTRLPGFPAATSALVALGFEAELVPAALPRNVKDVLGVTMGVSKFEWKTSGSQLEAGALGDNLTSYGARFDDKNGQTTVAEFIRAGAAGSSGTVIEPYAIQAKFPHPLLHAYYARGFSLAESFYLSVTGPYQLLIVGDAMCQPFSRPPGSEVTLASERGVVKGTVPIKLEPRQNSLPALRYDFYMDGLRVGTVGEPGTIRIDTTKHADGYHELRFVSVGIDSTQASSRVIVPLTFQNRGHQTTLEAKVTGKNLQLKASAAGATTIKIYGQGELLHEGSTDQVDVTLPLARVGTGPVVLQAIAAVGEEAVASIPRVIEVR